MIVSLRKYRDVAEMPEPWQDCDDPALWPAIAAAWARAALLIPRVPPPRGLHKFHSLDEAQRADEEWESARVLAAERTRTGV